MMLSGEKMYQPDDSFKELPGFIPVDENCPPVDYARVV